MEEEKKEEHEHHEHVEHTSKKNNLTEKVRENPWMLGTFVLSVLVVALLLLTFTGGITGNAISSSAAAEKTLAFYESAGISDLTLASIEEISGLYQVNLNYKGSVVPVYITKDGKNIAESLIPLESSSSTETETQEVPKSDKPEVELYVFTYCPYGLQMEKAIIPVANLFGSKIDLKIRQIGAMHGEYEEIEAKRQLCVEKKYPNKFLDYVKAFAEDTSIGSCNGDATCLVPKLNTLYNQLGIDASTINSCMTTDGVTMYEAEVQNSGAKGIGGSPTLVINGVEVSSGRSPEEIKGVICEAFNNVPSECSQTLSTAQASAGFGSGTDSGSSTASC